MEPLGQVMEHRLEVEECLEDLGLLVVQEEFLEDLEGVVAGHQVQDTELQVLEGLVLVMEVGAQVLDMAHLAAEVEDLVDQVLDMGHPEVGEEVAAEDLVDLVLDMALLVLGDQGAVQVVEDVLPVGLVLDMEHLSVEVDLEDSEVVRVVDQVLDMEPQGVEDVLVVDLVLGMGHLPAGVDLEDLEVAQVVIVDQVDSMGFQEVLEQAEPRAISMESQEEEEEEGEVLEDQVVDQALDMERLRAAVMVLEEHLVVDQVDSMAHQVDQEDLGELVDKVDDQVVSTVPLGVLLGEVDHNLVGHQAAGQVVNMVHQREGVQVLVVEDQDHLVEGAEGVAVDPEVAMGCQVNINNCLENKF